MHANHLYEAKACELDQRAVELATAEEETRRALNVAHREYNKALVRLTFYVNFLAKPLLSFFCLVWVLTCTVFAL